MKTQEPTVRPILLRKQTKEGLYPVVIRVQWNGRKEKRLGFSIPKSAWSTREEMVKKSYPNASVFNAKIEEELDLINSNKKRFIDEGISFTAADLFKSIRKSKSKSDWFSLCEEINSKRSFKYVTYARYYTVGNSIKSYLQHDFNVDIITVSFLYNYTKWLKNKQFSNGSIQTYVSTIASVYNYAVKNHYIPRPEDHPFDEFSKTKLFPAENNKKSISKAEYDEIEGLLLDMMLKNDSSSFLNPYTDESTLAMYVLGYRLGGLALIDMSKLKKEQVEIKKIHRDTFYMFHNVKRSKTNKPVPIILRQDIITKKLMDIYLSSPSNFLFPLFYKHTDANEKEKVSNITSATTRINKRLRKITGINNISYYSCRHTFATNFLNSPNTNPVDLAVLMGRSTQGIFTYVKEISQTEDIIAARQKMGL